MNNISLKEALREIDYLMEMTKGADHLSVKAEIAYIALRLLALIEEVGDYENLTNLQKLDVKDIALDLKLLSDGLVIKET